MGRRKERINVAGRCGAWKTRTTDTRQPRRHFRKSTLLGSATSSFLKDLLPGVQRFLRPTGWDTIEDHCCSQKLYAVLGALRRRTDLRQLCQPGGLPPSSPICMDLMQEELGPIQSPGCGCIRRSLLLQGGCCWACHSLWWWGRILAPVSFNGTPTQYLRWTVFLSVRRRRWVADGGLKRACGNAPGCSQCAWAYMSEPAAERGGAKNTVAVGLDELYLWAV